MLCSIGNSPGAGSGLSPLGTAQKVHAFNACTEAQLAVGKMTTGSPNRVRKLGRLDLSIYGGYAYYIGTWNGQTKKAAGRTCVIGICFNFFCPWQPGKFEY